MKLPYKLIGGVSGVAVAAALFSVPVSPVATSDAVAANPNPSGLRVVSPRKNETTVSGVFVLEAWTKKNADVAFVRFSFTDFATGSWLLRDDTDPSDGWTADWDTNNLTNGDYGVSMQAFDGAGQKVGEKGVPLAVAN